MVILKRNQLQWYPIPKRILEEREALERLQETLYEEPHFKGGKPDETDERQGDF